MKRKSFLVVLFLIVFSFPYVSYALSSYFSIYVIDRYFDKFLNDNSYSLVKESISLYEGFGDLEVSLSSDIFLKLSLPQRFLVPDRFFLTLRVSYSISDFYFEVGDVMKEDTITKDEVFVSLAYNLSLGEFISITPSLTSYYDFGGWYFEFRLSPSVFLPLTPVFSISIPVSFSALSYGYNGVNQSSLCGVTFYPRISVFFENFDFIVEGGYFLSLSGMFSSYPYVFLKVGREFK